MPLQQSLVPGNTSETVAERGSTPGKAAPGFFARNARIFALFATLTVADGAKTQEPIGIPPRPVNIPAKIDRATEATPDVRRLIELEMAKLRVEYDSRLRLSDERARQLEEKVRQLERDAAPNMVKVIDDVKRSCVRVHMENCSGSGTFVETPYGTAVLTACHVIRDNCLTRDPKSGKFSVVPTKILIDLYDGKDSEANKSVTARVMRAKAGKLADDGEPVVNARADVAFLWVDPKDLPKDVKPLKMLTHREVLEHVRQGENCCAVTNAGSDTLPSITINPNASSITLSRANGDPDLAQVGRIRHVNKSSMSSIREMGPVCIEHDMDSRPGCSGSAVIVPIRTERGFEPRVVGITNWVVKDDRKNISTRIDAALRSVHDLMPVMKPDEVALFDANVDKPLEDQRRRLLTELRKASFGSGNFFDRQLQPPAEKLTVMPRPLPEPKPTEPKKKMPDPEPPFIPPAKE